MKIFGIPGWRIRHAIKNWQKWPHWFSTYLVGKLHPSLNYEAINYDTTLREWMHYHQESVAFQNSTWMGVQLIKNPTDLWIYQELIWKVKPDVIVEIGSDRGGSTLYMAHLMDIMGKGEIISVDISRGRWQVSHPRISLVTGDSNAPETIAKVKELVAGRHAMVIHDGDHSSKAVLADLRAYASLVSVGSYYIVEDGIVDTLRAEVQYPHARLGPLDAIEKFLVEAPNFQIDHECERYFITQNPGGYLKRIA